MECGLKLAMDVVRGGVKMFYMIWTETTILKGMWWNCVDGNRKSLVQDCGGETVSIYVVGELLNVLNL